MIKFIPQFSCWKVNNFQLFVIASCAKTHEIQPYFLNTGNAIYALPRDARMPDVRLFTPCRWHALSAVQRATVRDVFNRYLIETYGEEDYPWVTISRGDGECE